ncbi:enolase C-terminal domain-like protein [Actinocorallia sp. A-T 12471]|uniref:enolase C-terminal domain-like protein n=1 Tax=Actinocorallia sp. A-T 12471 TaxID=3089813 RepID=UPI0029CE383C|nr:enolase C-terminal domain-like protein [Actinocorallia sp. A-T 12471]MDX6744419.1 enolase C-terminal domain-like protein [Actinocorallia sp. A-T 12471]
MPSIREFRAFRVALHRGRRPESVLVRLTADDGTVGWGECALLDDDTWTDLRERIGPALPRLEWDHPEDLGGLRALGGPRATAATEIAAWDLWGRLHGVPVAHALGGTRTSVVTGARIPVQATLEILPTLVNRYIGGGFSRVTLEIRPGWDIEPLRTVRAAYPTLALQVDGNGSYTGSPEHLAALEALDAYDLVAIERPFPDLNPHAELQRNVRAAVAPDITDLDTLRAAIDLDAGRALSLRVGTLGGLTAARAAHDLAYASGWDIWCGGSGVFGIGKAASVALASLPGCSLPSDITEFVGGPEYLTPPLRATGGVIAVPLSQPGLGHTIDGPRLTRLATDELTMKS